jgi:hypothetical protein
MRALFFAEGRCRGVQITGRFRWCETFPTAPGPRTARSVRNFRAVNRKVMDAATILVECMAMERYRSGVDRSSSCAFHSVTTTPIPQLMTRCGVCVRESRAWRI